MVWILIFLGINEGEIFVDSFPFKTPNACILGKDAYMKEMKPKFKQVEAICEERVINE